MTKAVRTSWLTKVLGLVPAPVLAALDAWSYRVALKHAERRRLAAKRKSGRRGAPQFELSLGQK